MASDFYDGFAEKTEAVLERGMQYVRLAIDNGDAIVQTKPGVFEITVRIRQTEKGKTDGNVQSN